jgi:hypothetical protein
MTRRFLPTVLISIALGSALIFFLVGADAADEIQKVLVVNFPGVQQVSGTVSIDGTIRHAVPRQYKDILVPPVSPSEVTRLIRGGTLETDGFTSVVLALNGQSQGKPVKSGVLGAILLPDEESVLRVFEEEGKTQFPLEIKTAPLTSASPYVASDSLRLVVGFPRYRIWLYNTSDRTVSANLFAYLAN